MWREKRMESDSSCRSIFCKGCVQRLYTSFRLFWDGVDVMLAERYL